MKDKFTVGLVVSNHYGVLNRITGLYAKRCYNINTLAVGETEDDRFSKMIIVSVGGEYERDQIVKQLRKLHDVKKVELFDKEITLNDAVLCVKDLK
ncbi:acetolactate synthase-1/3 small subunit [Elusimicrobium posterum]|uniref:acetolactate synthase small subunit n=1 Tax=Elusimicrobium posterum TaxID=3116653 RepID=UPI003C764306